VCINIILAWRQWPVMLCWLRRINKYCVCHLGLQRVANSVVMSRIIYWWWHYWRGVGVVTFWRIDRLSYSWHPTPAYWLLCKYWRHWYDSVLTWHCRNDVIWCIDYFNDYYWWYSAAIGKCGKQCVYYWLLAFYYSVSEGGSAAWPLRIDYYWYSIDVAWPLTDIIKRGETFVFINGGSYYWWRRLALAGVAVFWYYWYLYFCGYVLFVSMIFY